MPFWWKRCCREVMSLTPPAETLVSCLNEEQPHNTQIPLQTALRSTDTRLASFVPLITHPLEGSGYDGGWSCILDVLVLEPPNRWIGALALLILGRPGFLPGNALVVRPQQDHASMPRYIKCRPSSPSSPDKVVITSGFLVVPRP